MTTLNNCDTVSELTVDFNFSETEHVYDNHYKHFKQMLSERKITEKWVDQTLQTPDSIEDRDDGTRHYIKQISEYKNRWPRIVVNVNVDPNRTITPFFIDG